MKTKHIASLAFVLALFGGSAIAADKVVVIVNAKNTQALTSTDIKNIYNDNVVTSARDTATEWANKKITNTAKNPPVTKPDSVVLSNVAKDPDAIGYVPASAAAGKDGVQVILTIE